jgi:hypothetical protein
MTRAISIGILAGGILLLIFGITAYDSSSSDISRLITGSPTNEAIWLLVGGATVTVLGLVGLVLRSKTA